MKNNNILWIFLHMHKTGGTTFNAHLAEHFKANEFLHLDSEKNQEIFKKLKPEDKENMKILTGHETYYGIHDLFPGKEPRYIIFIRDPAERLVSQYNHHMSQLSDEEKIPFEKWYKNYPKNEMTLFLNQRTSPFKKKVQKSFFFKKTFGKITDSRFWKKIRYPLKSLQSGINSRKRLEDAKRLLDKCWFVAITKNLDKDLQFICKEMKIPLNWKNMRVTGEKKSWKDEFIGKDIKPAQKNFALDEKTRARIYKENPLDVELYVYAKKLNKEKTD